MIVCFVCFALVSSGQSKKEQILILSNRLDSLNEVLVNESNLAQLKSAMFNSKLDSVEKRLLISSSKLIECKADLENENRELESLKSINKKKESELSRLKELNNKLQFQLDSVLKMSQDQVEIFVDFETVFVEGGQFQMGSNLGSFNEKPAHKVTVSSFNISKYEVTQAQWFAVMGETPSNSKDCDQCPVENISWNQIQDFIRRLNVKTGKNFRLPTEAEWEYAAKGGKYFRGNYYSGSNDCSSVAWYSLNSGAETHPVGQKQANELGLFDMSGNVWEWCSDWYGMYSNISQINPQGASPDLSHVLRGGSCNTTANLCSALSRLGGNPITVYGGSGFRLVYN
jgi:formylglycine-generating enzyme required for sulfatase activity